MAISKGSKSKSYFGNAKSGNELVTPHNKPFCGDTASYEKSRAGGVKPDGGHKGGMGK